MTDTNLTLSASELSALLESEIPSTTPDPKLPAKPQAKSFRTKQFTLVSLPCLTIYLQGYPNSSPPAVEDFTFNWALESGALKLRVLGYPSLPLATKRAIASTFTNLIRSNQLFTPAHASLVTSLVKQHPTLITSAGGLPALASKALNATAAASTVAEWLHELEQQDTNFIEQELGTELSATDLDSLVLELV